MDNASEFRENPTCKTYYITTGIRNKDDKNVEAVVETYKKDLISLNLFETVEANVVDANELGKLYRKTKNPVSAKITFVSKVALPEVEGIDESFYGVLPFSEFRKLIIDENGNIRSVFDDNVRDFQGKKNPVNSSIKETLDGPNPSLFSVLNNGITIVADSVKSSANTLTLSDYQIVNGCQTSNVLYENRKNKQIQNISIPVRLIATRNEEIRALITVSTNNQTAIKKEQLSAMSDFQKNLQHYYATIEGDGKLYYERRAKEYNSDRKVVKRRIITIANQLKSFSSMFNKDPHQVTTYFGKLAKNIGEPGRNLFEPDHCFAPYYLSGLTYYRLDSLFNSSDIEKRFKKVRFYLIMLVPLIASSEDLPPLNSRRKTDKYCDPIIKKLNDPEKCRKIFLTAVKIISESEAAIDDKQSLKSRAMTDQILQAYKGEKV
ncbi:MAG: AIPR family protein [Cyanobacteria bacterium J06621_8]